SDGAFASTTTAAIAAIAHASAGTRRQTAAAPGRASAATTREASSINRSPYPVFDLVPLGRRWHNGPVSWKRSAQPSSCWSSQRRPPSPPPPHPPPPRPP